MKLDRIRQLRTYLGQRQSHHSLTIDNGQAAELDAALAAAEALARLEAWLADNRSELVCWKRVAADGFTAMFSARSDGEDGHGPALLAALTAALDEAEAKPIARHGP